MKYMILGAAMASILVTVGLNNVLFQPVNASIDFFDICKTNPKVCDRVVLPWWLRLCPGCPEGFDIRDILTIPENQSYSVSVRHGPISDTIMIEIPRAMSSAMLNNSAVGFDPKPEPPGNQSQSN